jgi:hypothetical protein
MNHNDNGFEENVPTFLPKNGVLNSSNIFFVKSDQFFCNFDQFWAKLGLIWFGKVRCF